MNGRSTLIAGGSTITTYEIESTYTRTAHGYRPGPELGYDSPYRQNSYPNAREDFADMYMNYIFNSFASDDAGSARYAWMENHMSAWISLAIANNR